jgi:hypothetical protein
MVLLVDIGGVPVLDDDPSLSLLEVALALLSLGPSGGLILAGRNASGGAGREGPFPLTFL